MEEIKWLLFLLINQLKLKLFKHIDPELQLYNANASNTEAPYLDIHLFISNGFVSPKMYDKRDGFDLVNIPLLGS